MLKSLKSQLLKKSFIDIGIMGFGNIFNAGLGFLFITAVAKVMPVDEFGRYALLASLLVSFAKLIDFGSNSLFVAKSITHSEDILDTFLSLKILLSLITLPIALISLYFLDLLSTTTATIFTLGFIAYAFNYTFFSFFQKLEKFKHAVLINTAPSLIKGTTAALIFLGIFTPTLSQAFAVFSLSIFTSLFFYFFLPEKLRHFDFSVNGTLDLFKQAAPAGFSLVLHESWATILNTLSKLAKSFTEVGIFSMANKISEVFALISVSIFTVLLPKNAARKKNRREYDVKESFIISIGIILLAFTAVFVARIFLTAVFGDKFNESIGIIGILIFGSAFSAIHTFMHNYFFVEGKTKVMLLLSIIELSTLLTLAFVLVPAYSLRGLALANLITSMITLAVTVFIIWRSLSSPWAEDR